MIQTVGIKFEAQGLNTVIVDMRALSTAVKSLATGIKALENLNVSAAVANLNKLASGMTAAASQLVTAANQVNYAATSFSQANTGMGAMQPAATTAPKGTTASQQTKGPWYGGGEILRTTGNLAKYTAAFGLLFGAKEFAQDTLLGDSRRSLVDPQLNLHAIGYKTKEDKRGVEYAASDFLSEIRGNIKREDFMKSVAEMGSALPHDDPKSPAMNKQTHVDMAKIAVAFGKLSQMTPDAASQHLESLVSAIYNMGNAKDKWRMRHEPGYAAEMTGNIAGQAYKAIDIFKMRGQDQADFMKYMTPTMLEKGWDFPTMMAVAGLATTVGFKASSTGRGAKTLLDVHPEKLGELMLAGSEDVSVAAKYKGGKAADRKAAGMAEFRKYEDEFRGDLVGWLSKRLGPAAQKAQQRGFNLADFSGANFLPLERLLTNMEALKELAKYVDIVRTQSPRGFEIVDEYKKALGDENAGTRMDNFISAWTRLTQAIADGNGPLSKFTGGIVDLSSRLLDWSAKIQEKINQRDGNKTDQVKGLLGEVPTFSMDRNRVRPAINNLEGMANYAGSQPLQDLERRAMANLKGESYSPLSKDAMSGGNMGMWKPPEIAPNIVTSTVQVYGTGEVRVVIDDQGFFQRVNKAIIEFQQRAGNAVSNTANSTGRAVGEAEGTATLGGMF